MGTDDESLDELQKGETVHILFSHLNVISFGKFINESLDNYW